MTLRSLRLRLTLLYLLVALALIAFVGGGAYRLLEYHFRSSTDLALQHRMADQFLVIGASLPSDLAAAQRDWYASRVPSRLVPPASPTVRPDRSDEHDDEARRRRRREEDDERRDVEVFFDSDLAAIFVLPLGADGTLLEDPNAVTPPVGPDQAALASALANGSDWRTLSLNDGTRIRLLTYPVPPGDGPAAFQLGRAMADQDRLLSQLLTGLLGLGVVGATTMGIGSWWLAGRSLRPMEQAWERQQTFVANAGHELRTPLTLIRASAEVARRGLPADDERGLLMDDVLVECDHVSRLVEDLLLLSRLDVGQVRLERKAIVLDVLLADLQRQVGRLAEARGVRLAVAGGGVVLADPIRLRQVLLILLDNALRHTPAGRSIRIDAAAAGRQVRIAVADTGSGIDPKHLPHVFERFYRASSTHDGESGGYGLGLAIARALVEAQHGRIQIESRVGEGTIVAVVLPSAQGQAS